jgi:hypothetical protein
MTGEETTGGALHFPTERADGRDIAECGVVGHWREGRNGRAGDGGIASRLTVGNCIVPGAPGMRAKMFGEVGYGRRDKTATW